jgi:hypothetical protein
MNNVRGILYSPQLYLGRNDADLVVKRCNNSLEVPHKAALAFLWYRTLLRNTLQSDPILYCHGKTKKIKFIPVKKCSLNDGT